MYCPVYGLYTIACGAFISRQKQMRLPSSCLGVHQWKPAVSSGLEQVFTALWTLAHVLVCLHNKVRDSIRVNTQEKTKLESGRYNAPDGNAAVQGDVESTHRKESQLGEVSEMNPLGHREPTWGSKSSVKIDRALVHDRCKSQGQEDSCCISLQYCFTIFRIRNASPTLTIPWFLCTFQNSHSVNSTIVHMPFCSKL